MHATAHALSAALLARRARCANDATPSHEEAPEEASAVRLHSERAWNTVVLNDPINTQDYVVFVLRSHFGYSLERSRALMLEVHHEGQAVVSRDGREQAEAHVSAMHAFGLLAIIEEA